MVHLGLPLTEISALALNTALLFASNILLVGEAVTAPVALVIWSIVRVPFDLPFRPYAVIFQLKIFYWTTANTKAPITSNNWSYWWLLCCLRLCKLRHTRWQANVWPVYPFAVNVSGFCAATFWTGLPAATANSSTATSWSQIDGVSCWVFFVNIHRSRIYTKLFIDCISKISVSCSVIECQKHHILLIFFASIHS